jgi:hypothetical protein
MPATDAIGKAKIQKMESEMTAATRVQRRLKSGPHVRKLPNALSVLDAVHRLTGEADRAQSAMLEEQLDPEDIHLGLIFLVSTDSPDGLQESLGVQWLGTPDKIGEFIMSFEQRAKQSRLMFLGILWALLDREDNRGIMWAKPLVSGQDERMKLSVRLFQVPHLR